MEEGRNMEKTIEKLQKLHQSAQKLETVLHEVWSLIDEIEEDKNFTELLKQAKQHQSKKQQSKENLEELFERLKEFESTMGEIPEDGTVALDFEDAISELIEWMKNNK
jgi:superfamily I DNA/RNA helicase